MISKRRFVFVLALGALLGAGSLVAQQPRPNALPTTVEEPDLFGIQNHSRTFVTALAFYPSNSSAPWGTSGSLGRIVFCCGIVDFYANLDIPQDVIIDYIGLNNLTDANFVLGLALYGRSGIGDVYPIGEINSTAGCCWHTDRNVDPIGFHRQPFDPLILHVQGNSQANSQFFAHVEVGWRRRVGPGPATATFDDVPVGHPQRQFVEALVRSGITAGCAPNLFCPDQPLTRGQMAVFLAVALGL